MADEEFNSSDIEFDEAPQHPYANAGMKSIDAIIESGFSDRISSKKATKSLIFTELSPKTEYTTAVWNNRFVAFREHSLQQR
jgi:hypothetical protein